MKIEFGMYLDGSEWSRSASMGELTAGPLGLLGIIETKLGLGGPVTRPARRIDGYMRRMEARDKAAAWPHESFLADPWSAASQMLAWRDQLVEWGWDGTPLDSASPRLAALSDIEKMGGEALPGPSDRMRKVVRTLEKTASISISEIKTSERDELLPNSWREIFSLLERAGVNILRSSGEYAPRRGDGLSSSCLGLLQANLSGAANGAAQMTAVHDDTFACVLGGDEWETAEAAAIWMSNLSAESARNVSLICQGDSEILDQALSSRGLPMIGASEKSGAREILQLLPILIGISWKPFDAGRLAEFLSMPSCPLPMAYARILLRALTEEPGVGGEAWKNALTRITEAHSNYLERRLAEKDGGTPDKSLLDGEAAKFASGIDRMFASGLYPQEEGIPESRVSELCRLLSKRLASHLNDGEPDPLIRETAAISSELGRICEGKGPIPRITMERILDSLTGDGMGAPDRFRQASPWTVAGHPGGVIEPTGTVIWWNFENPATRSETYWSDEELGAMRKAGMRPDEPQIAKRREAFAWRRAFMNASEKFIAFRHTRRRGEPVERHPFYDELIAAAGSDASLEINADGLFKESSWRLAGQAAPAYPAKAAALPQAAPEFRIPENSAPKPEKMSFSDMEKIISCPMMWTLRHVPELRKPEAYSLPAGNLMIGRLCHVIARDIFTSRSFLSREEAKKSAEALYEKLVPSMASELLLPGSEVKNIRVKKDIAIAVGDLADALSRLNLKAVASERRHEADFDGVPFVGVIDMILEGPNGEKFILDMKWSFSSKYKKEEVAEGRALQLASYAWLLRSESGGQPHAGYFMLAQGELLSGSPLLREDSIESKIPLAEVFERGKRTWENETRKINEGKLEASGVYLRSRAAKGEKEEKIIEELKNRAFAESVIFEAPMCRFCDFGALCGMRSESL